MFKLTLDQMKESIRSVKNAQLDPNTRRGQRQARRRNVRLRNMIGRHVVIVYRKGGRITEQWRYDSESDVLADVKAVGTVDLAFGTRYTYWDMI